ncbi:MAG: signal recognition particle receptor subunit alpha, partial [Actinomycetota bacterium]
MIASQQPILLALVALVLSFGVGTIVFSRRASRDRASLPDSPVVNAVMATTVAVPTETDLEVVVETQPDVADAEQSPNLKTSIGRARSLFATAFSGIRSRSSIDESTWEELEDTLIRADVGVHLAQALLAPLRERVREKSITTPDMLIDALRVAMKEQLSNADRSLRINTAVSPSVWLFVGVNGVGKT